MSAPGRPQALVPEPAARRKVAAPALAGAAWPVPSAATAAQIGRAATLALYDELALAPKPGLVSFFDSGSHRDMDAQTFMRSLFALRRTFSDFVSLGAQDVAFPILEHEGLAAEARMLKATGGINTHRGAIFTLGLLCASAGRLWVGGEALDAPSLRRSLLDRWGEALARRANRAADSHGARAAARFGLRSASVEAALGFPVLFDTALPALYAALRRGLTARAARLDALFATMAVLDDTNIAHRGGIDALRYVKRAAADYMGAGGSGRPDAAAHAQSLHRAFVERKLSPGGAADMLGAACWLQRVCEPPER
jgi:triphosphoribosyl-dephospho-CoA synthase